MAHRTLSELTEGLAAAGPSPGDQGVVELIVRRPSTDAREVLDEGHLDPDEGLAGDNWSRRGSSRTADGSPHPGMQLTLMSARVIGLVAGDRSRWSLAGDQLIVDLDLSLDNLPAGTRLHVGSEAVIEVTEQPHTGCGKFAERFGVDALKFLNTPEARRLRLRGLYARVVTPGIIRPGDVIRKG